MRPAHSFPGSGDTAWNFPKFFFKLHALFPSDPYVKIKLLDRKGKRIGKKKKTSVKMANLNPYYNESFVFVVEEHTVNKVELEVCKEREIVINICWQVNLEVTVLDYDMLGGSDAIGKVTLGKNRKKLEKKHWVEMVENPRRPIIHWHQLKDPEPGDGDDEEKKKKKDSKVSVPEPSQSK